MRAGRPVAKIELSAEVASILEGYTQRRKTAQGLALRGADRFGMRLGPEQQGGGGARAGDRADRRQVAPALSRARCRRAAR